MWNFIFNLAQQSGTYGANAAAAGVYYNKQFERSLIKALLKLLALITVLWVINIVGWQALNLIPFFGVTVLLIAVGFSPIALSATALTGALTRADQIKGVPTGIPAGAQIWIVQVLPAIIVSCHILIGFLATWSFAANPFAFWYFAMACVTICSAVLAWKKMKGDFLYKLVIGYSAIVAIFALVTTQWPEAGKLLNREGRVELQQQQVVAERLAEIAEATHAAELEAAATVILDPVVTPGCDHPSYASLPNWNCQTVSLPAGAIHDYHVPVAGCVKTNAHHDVIFLEPDFDTNVQPLQNTSAATRTFFVYTLADLPYEKGPDGKSCKDDVA